MQTRFRRTCSRVAILALLVSTAAWAEEPAAGKAPTKRAILNDAIKKDRADLKDARKDLRDAVKSADAGAAAQAKEDLKQGREELKEDREERRKAQKEELQKKYGADLEKPGVKEELRKHHRRMARLRRIGQLAKASNKDGIQKRAEAAIMKEKTRHDAAMTQLTKGGAK